MECAATARRDTIGRLIRPVRPESILNESRLSSTAEKGGGTIPILRSHLAAEVEGLANIEAQALPDIARAAEEGCTITAAIRGTVGISVDVVAI